MSNAKRGNHLVFELRRLAVDLEFTAGRLSREPITAAMVNGLDVVFRDLWLVREDMRLRAIAYREWPGPFPFRPIEKHLKKLKF